MSSPNLSTPYDYFSLLKPRVMSLVVFTGLSGALLAPNHGHVFFSLLTIVMIAVGSGAAGAINMWYERDLDKKMQRTQNRPLPRGIIAPGNALAFGVILAVGSVTILALVVNGLAASLLLGAILFYVFIYTIWLKPRTPHNIVIGGAAGAFPPLIGWAGATGEISLEAVMMFALIFFWTPPHFWALALVKNDDYRRAQIPMMPVSKGDVATKLQMLLYGLLLLPLSLCFYYPLGFAGAFYGASALILSLEFVRRIIILQTDKANKTAFALFRYSIIYLFLLFVLLLYDKFIMPLFHF